MMLAYNTTAHTSTGFTPHRLVFGEECNLPGNLVHRELRPDPPPRDNGDYASWVRQALYEAYDEVRTQQQRATHRQKRNYDSIAVVRTFPIGYWVLRYYPPARKNKLCSPWIGPYKIVRAPMEWVVGIQVDADARIFYVHMDDLKRCVPPDPTPSWPDVARGTSIVLSTRIPSIDIYHIWFNVFIPKHLGVNQCKDVDVWILDVGHGVEDAKKAEIQYVIVDDSPGEETRGSDTSYSEHIVIEQPGDGFQYLRDKMSGFLLAFKSKARVSKYSSYFNSGNLLFLKNGTIIYQLKVYILHCFWYIYSKTSVHSVTFGVLYIL